MCSSPVGQTARRRIDYHPGVSGGESVQSHRDWRRWRRKQITPWPYPAGSKSFLVESEFWRFRDYGTSYALATIDQYPPPAPDDGITP